MNDLIDVLRIRLSSSFNHIPVVFSRIINEIESESKLWLSRGVANASLEGRRNYFEFGVWNGYSMLQAHRAVRLTQSKRVAGKWSYYGFDSFEGLPLSNSNKDVHPRADKNTFVSNGLKYVTDLLLGKGFSPSRLQLIPGYFDQVLTETLREELGVNHVAFVNFDVDYYSSTMIALEWIKPLLYNGSICFFDDIYFYNGHTNKGQVKCIKDFNSQSDNYGLSVALDLDPTGRTYRYWTDDA